MTLKVNVALVRKILLSLMRLAYLFFIFYMLSMGVCKTMDWQELYVSTLLIDIYYISVNAIFATNSEERKRTLIE